MAFGEGAGGGGAGSVDRVGELWGEGGEGGWGGGVEEAGEVVDRGVEGGVAVIEGDLLAGRWGEAEFALAHLEGGGGEGNGAVVAVFYR